MITAGVKVLPNKATQMQKELIKANLLILQKTGKFGTLKTEADLTDFRANNVAWFKELDEKDELEPKAETCGYLTIKYIKWEDGYATLYTINHDGTPYLSVRSKPDNREKPPVWKCFGCGETWTDYKDAEKHRNGATINSKG